MSNPIFQNDYQILSVHFAYTKQQKKFAILKTNNADDFDSAIVWNYDTCGLEFKAGEKWTLVGQLKEYKDDVSLHIDPIGCVKLEETSLLNHSNYLTDQQIDDLHEKFKNYIDTISDKQTKRIIQCAVLNAQKAAVNYNTGDWSADDLQKTIRNAPGSTTKHHCYRGGFLDHVCEMLDAADALLRLERYRNLNRDVVIGGIICHDIGKLLTYSSNYAENSPKRTFLDMSFGHIAIGYKLFIQAYESVEFEGCSNNNPLIHHIEHIILSHHGTREWGSPCSPCSAEAALVHTIDMLSSQVNFAQMSATGSLTFHDKFENFSNIDKDHQIMHSLQLAKDSHFFTHESFSKLQATRV